VGEAVTVRAFARCACLAALIVLARVPPLLAAQSSVVVVSGRVLGGDGRPLASASVSVAPLDGVESRVDSTKPDGSYRVVMNRRASAFFVVVRKSGFATQTRQVAGTATDSVIAVADFRMVRSAQALSTVRVLAPRSPPLRDQERIFSKPGESEYTLDPSSGFASALTGDASGDLQLALGGIPGVALTPGPGGSASYTIAGLDEGQNRVTLNGADVSPIAVRDGGIVRVLTSGYDPTEAMSGVRTEWMILGANYVPNRRLRLSFDAPLLQRSNRIATALGQRSAAPILSGVIGGPGKGFVRFYNTMFQVSRRADALGTLGSIDEAALTVLGVSADSVQHLLGALDGLGIGSPASTRSAVDRVTTSGRVYSRLDFTTNSIGLTVTTPEERVGGQSFGRDQGRVFYLLVGGDAAESRGTGAGGLTLPAFATSSRSQGFTAQAFNSAYPREYILNETRLSATISGSRSAPDSPLPAAAVLTSTTGVQGGTIATLNAAGNGGAASTMRNWSLQARNDTHWSSPGGRHQWKIALESQVDAISVRRDASRGRFEFASVEEFLANRPSAFSRSIAPTSTDVRGLHVAAALGDLYTPSRALAWQYGVRLEGHGVLADAARNRVIDSLFGTRTGGVPMRFSVAPMVGLTWRYKPMPNGHPSNSHLIMGGIRDYRGALPTRGAQELVAETGLASGLRELRCVDTATPRPEWERYGDLAAIPTGCAVGSPNESFVQSARPVSLYSPDFVFGHSVRAEAQWMAPISRTVHLSVGGMTAVNTSQPLSVDLNFDGVPRFTLPDEVNRPVFVSPANVGVESGLTSLVESRRYPQYSHVNERRSDLRSRSSSLTGALRVYPVMSRFGSGIKVPLQLSYTFTDTHEQATGFRGTTASDPRVVDWQPAPSSRHAVLFSAKIHVPDWFDLFPGLTLRSGVRYTPMVQGDANADGLSNDRAFVFDPRATNEGELRAAMSALLESAPGHASRCLREQLGRVTAPNSCTAPWAAMVNANLIVDPARVRLQNRGLLQLRLINVLAGLDQLAHGADRIHGWGQLVFPDPVLLRIRGFDPVARRYRYTVNPSFGDTRGYRTAFHSPFRIAIEVALDVGPNRERAEIAKRLAPDGADGPVRLDSATLAERMRSAHDPRALFEPVIRRAEQFSLTPAQVDSLDVLGRAHSAFRDSTYDALAGYIAARGGKLGDADVERRWRESVSAVARFEWHTGALARALLTPAQADGIFGRSGPLSVRPIIYDERELERTLRLWQQRVY
jgi:hypothetical protein